MEIHHHAHTPRKKWTHYFWEFLMLFLAVFCGFLAEYQLEHTIEKNRERQYVKSLVNDLISDTAQLNFIIRTRTEKIARLDSFKMLLNSDSYKMYGKGIYFFAMIAARRTNIKFFPNNGTMQQLKNAGGLRLISKRSVVDKITKYDGMVREMELFAEVEENMSQNYRQVAYRFFDSFVFDRMEDIAGNITLPDGNPEILPFTKDDLNRINYAIYGIKAATRGGIRFGTGLLNEAKSLINILKTEYHLE